MKKLLLLFLCLVSFYALWAQEKSTENIGQIWLGYFNKTRLTYKWGLWTDLHLRTKEDFTDKFSQSIIRLGLTYYVNDVTKLTIGYAYVNLYPGDNHKKITQPESRPWQQLQWHTQISRAGMMQWIRLEERFRHKILNDSTLADGYNFNFRIRYNIFYEVPLHRKGFTQNLSFVVNDEVFINFGKEIVYNYFDQNRFFAGIKYQTNKQGNIQFGYMNLFQQLASENKYKNIHAARVFYFHNLDLRKKKI